MDNSYLRQRRDELLAGDQLLPLAYEQLRERASDHLPAGAYDYVAGGAGSEDTILENRLAFQRYRILTHALKDVSERDLSSELFGRDVDAPLVLAPIGRQQEYHEEGELATARATSELNIPMALSYNSSHPLEDVAEASAGGPQLFQLYWPNDWDIAASLVRRAEDAGYDGIVLTIDSKLPKWRIRNLENGYGREGTPKANLTSDPVVRKNAEEAGVSVQEFVQNDPLADDDPSITWDDLDQLRSWTDLPIVLKGILRAEDARRASEWGADGIVVSTHGGRQIDGEIGSLDQLPKIAAATDEDTTVILDSGVRSGSDVFKALALGADAVQFGRPYIFSLAIAGEAGVQEVIRNYLAELESIMGLAGAPTIDEISQEFIIERPTVITNLE